jgi:hypothetical protein
MKIAPSKGGSSISARNRTPSIDLAKLAELLTKSVPSGAEAAKTPLITADGAKIRVNTRAVLGRLMRDEAFSPSFSPGEDAGFIRDMVMPSAGTQAKIGGRLVPGSEALTAKHLSALEATVKTEMDAALASFDLKGLVANTLEKTLVEMGQTLGERLPLLPNSASIVPIHFAPQGRNAVEKEKDIARVLSAMETVDGRDWLEVLLGSMSRRLTNDGLDIDEIDAILAAVRKQRNQPGSQVEQLLEFLEDEALSRVRMQVGMRLMEAVAAQSNKPGLKDYVCRVKKCFDLFAGVEGESLLLDVSAAYGISNNVDLASELRKALF